MALMKPGAHLAVICPGLQHHCITAEVEDSGMEVRDCLLFLGHPSYMICLARVPLEGTVARNVLKYGVGGLNIDSSRIEIREAEREIVDNRSGSDDGERGGIYSDGVGKRLPGVKFKSHVEGRYPANLLHDGSSGIVNSFPKAGGGFGVVGPKGSRRGGIMGTVSDNRTGQVCGFGDSGSAARFFFSVTNGNKVEGLTEYLVRLISPPNGKILVLGVEGGALNNLGFEVCYEV